MGMRIGFSSSAGRASDAVPAAGDPRPERFEIVRTYEAAGWCLAEIRWPDAKNYEGRKIALYQASHSDLRAATKLDPHFQEARGPLVPVARFEPTACGWDLGMALIIQIVMTGKENQ
jgi:hypothetical protein